MKFELDGGLNVLNFAIEQERISIVKYLAKLTEGEPKLRKLILEHRHGKDRICAIHQAMTIGNLALI